jgi:hypothetical protein
MRRLTDRNARRLVADRKRRVDQRSAVHQRGAACGNGGWRCAYPPYTGQKQHIHQKQHVHPEQHIHQARIYPDPTSQESIHNGPTRQGRTP